MDFLAYPEAALSWAVDAFSDSLLYERYHRYDAYYHGQHDLRFASPKFETAFGSLFRDFSYNRCSAVVDAHSDRLFVESFEIDGGSEDVQSLVDEVWKSNRMEKRQDEIYTESLATGDGYVMVWPDVETGQPVLWPQRSRDIRVIYSEERPGQIMAAAKAWRMRTGHARLNVYVSDRIDRWVSDAPLKPGAGLTVKRMIPYTDDVAGPIVLNPWLRVPIFAFANNARTGELGNSELRDIIPLQNALNKSLIDLMVTQEFAAFSQKVVIGIEANPDPYTSSNPDAGAANDATLRKFSLGVDRILAIADPAAKIAEFSAAALQQFVDVAEAWDARISRVSKVPVHYLTLTSNFPSGRALRTAEAPFVAKLEDRQRSFGGAWTAAMNLALAIAGVDEIEPEPVWRSAAPMAEEDSWDIITQMIAAGVPLPVAVKKELGWDDDEIAALEEKLNQKAEADAFGMVQQAVDTMAAASTQQQPPDQMGA